MPNTVYHITPYQVNGGKKSQFPDAVLEAFNELIEQSFSNECAVVLQKEVVALMVQKGLDKNAIYKNNWLDVEDEYRSVGWLVRYDKPMAYGGESYDANFEFFVNENHFYDYCPKRPA